MDIIRGHQIVHPDKYKLQWSKRSRAFFDSSAGAVFAPRFTFLTCFPRFVDFFLRTRLQSACLQPHVTSCHSSILLFVFYLCRLHLIWSHIFYYPDLSLSRLTYSIYWFSIHQPTKNGLAHEQRRWWSDITDVGLCRSGWRKNSRTRNFESYWASQKIFGLNLFSSYSKIGDGLVSDARAYQSLSLSVMITH